MLDVEIPHLLRFNNDVPFILFALIINILAASIGRLDRLERLARPDSLVRYVGLRWLVDLVNVAELGGLADSVGPNYIERVVC